MKRSITKSLLVILIGFVAWSASPTGELGTEASAQALPDVASLFERQKNRVVSVQTEVGRAVNPYDRAPMRQGQGSGFIVDSSGYIVTNNHVIQGASKILVGFENGDSFPASLVGADPSTDIALLKIDAKRPLGAVTLGDSSALRVGEWVVAIGNPFGLDYSVTAGIISAKGRNIGAGPYDNFIQTDASINPGNSGGPLFNMKGEVVGVNTAIIRDGQGIGFAVPIDMVKSMLPQLKANGRVSRGFMGAGIQPLDDDLARAFKLPRKHGVVIGSLEDGGPAAAAGLRPGDVVTHFNTRRVTETQELLLAVAESPVGKPVTVQYVRDGKATSTSLVVAERPDTRGAQRPTQNAPAQTPQAASLGITVIPMDPQLAQRLGVRPDQGVVVTQVTMGSPGAQVLRPGDVILQVGSVPVRSQNDLEKALSEDAQIYRFLVQRGGRTVFVAVKR
jgi:serine protease Do